LPIEYRSPIRLSQCLPYSYPHRAWGVGRMVFFFLLVVATFVWLVRCSIRFWSSPPNSVPKPVQRFFLSPEAASPSGMLKERPFSSLFLIASCSRHDRVSLPNALPKGNHSGPPVSNYVSITDLFFLLVFSYHLIQ